MDPQRGTGADAAYAAMVDTWANFFIVAGTAAATLIGLVFLALSLNPQVMADDGPIGLRAWARQTLSNLFGVLAIALVGLIPDQDPWHLGYTLLLTGIFGCYQAVRRFDAIRTERDRGWWERHTRWDFVIQGLGFAVILLVAVDTLFDDRNAFIWLVVAVFILIWSAITNAWDVLAEIGYRLRDRDHAA